MATILYGRVSTAEQTIEHQLTQAEAAGFKFDQPSDLRSRGLRCDH
jgi:putative DNA-invertase from lambdoid prophage Rac